MKKIKTALIAAAAFAGIAAAGQLGTAQAAAPYTGTVNYVKPWGIALWNGYGKEKEATSRKLPADSRWATYKAVQGDDGNVYFNLGGNQYISGDYLDLNNEYSTQPMVGVVKINYVPGYGIMIWKNAGGTGALNKYLKHGTSWKVFQRAVVNGHTWYNLGGNQWLDSQYAILTQDISRKPKTYTQNNPLTANNGGGSSVNGGGSSTNNGGSSNNNGGGSSTNNGGSTNGGDSSDNGNGDKPELPNGSFVINPNFNEGLDFSSHGLTNDSNVQYIQVHETENGLDISKDPSLSDAGLKKANLGAVWVVPKAGSTFRYAELAGGILAKGPVGSHFKVQLPTVIYTHNGADKISFDAPNGGIVEGTIQKTGFDTANITYIPERVQTMDPAKLIEVSYEALADYRSSHGLPAFTRDPNMERQARNALISGYSVGNVFVDVEAMTYLHNKQYNEENWRQDFPATVDATPLAGLAKLPGTARIGIACQWNQDNNHYELCFSYQPMN